jgi:hypothetical protein
VIVTIGKAGFGVGVDCNLGVDVDSALGVGEGLSAVGDRLSTEFDLSVFVGVASSPQANAGKANNKMKSKNLQ